MMRRKAARDIRRNPLDIPIDSRIAGGGGRLHQSACIERCAASPDGRRKMLVKMATVGADPHGGGIAEAFVRSESGDAWRLFVVHRNTLAIQAEDAFASICRICPSLILSLAVRNGRRCLLEEELQANKSSKKEIAGFAEGDLKRDGGLSSVARASLVKCYEFTRFMQKKKPVEPYFKFAVLRSICEEFISILFISKLNAADRNEIADALLQLRFHELAAKQVASKRDRPYQHVLGPLTRSVET